MLQFVRFGIVGGSGVLVNMVVVVIMTKLHGGTQRDNDPLFWFTDKFAFRYTILVWIVSFIIANFYNFLLNRYWTFKREHRRPFWTEFWPFYAVGSVAAIVGLLIKWSLTTDSSPVYLPSPMFNDHQGLRARAYWSQLIAIICTLPINFIVNKLWTFRAVQNHQPGRDDLPMVAPVVDPKDVDDTGEIRVAELREQLNREDSARG